MAGAARSAAARATSSGTSSASSDSSGPKKDSFDLTTLTPGSWLLYPGYQTQYGSYVDPTGTPVTVVAGLTVDQNLTVPYQAPTEGLLTGSVTVIGAPGEGFESGVEACSAPPVGLSCDDEISVSTDANGHYQLDLPAGTWWVAGFAYLFEDGQEALSPPRQVVVTAGVRSKANFSVDASGS